MEIEPFIELHSREELRSWLIDNCETCDFAWIPSNRSIEPKENTIPYTEIVEECLCFGWIDSTCKRMGDSRLAQRISPRRKQSHWTELNKKRCRDLEDLGLMTDFGRIYPE